MAHRSGGDWSVAPTMKKLFAGMAKLAAAAPWHCAQLLVVLGALAWMLASAGITVKSALVWQAVHCAPVAYGMWLSGTAVLANEAVVWQVSHDAVVTGWVAGLPVADTPLWHVAHSRGMAIAWS